MIKISGIYAIKNKINNKLYIGKSIDVNVRYYSRHRKNLINNNHGNDHLQKSWNKYGEQNFEFYIIEECSEEKLNEREIYWINYYKSYNNKYGYNMTLGGDGGSLIQESRDKISKKLKGRKLTLEHRKKISKVVRNRKYPPEFGQKISEILKGHIVTQETCEKISNKCKGYKHTEEAKRKISEANKNRSQETLDKISKSNTGKKRSEEVRKKMIEAAKKRKPISEETKLKISNTLKNKNKNKIIRANNT